MEDINKTQERLDKILASFESILRENEKAFCDIFEKIDKNADISKLNGPEYFLMVAILDLLHFYKNLGIQLKKYDKNFVKTEIMILSEVMLHRAKVVGILK